MKTLSGEESINVGCLCLLLPTETSHKLADYRYSRSTICFVSSLCEVYVSTVTCAMVRFQF